MLKLVKQNPISIEIDITAALTTLGKTTDDITDIAFVVKTQASDADNDSVLIKKLSDDGIVLTAGKYYVPLVSADYADFTLGHNYSYAVGILYSGISNFLELTIDDNLIQVIGDYIRA